jgi:hypothetical protein
MGSITTAGSGNWSSTTADAPWPGGTVPIEGDNVVIASGHTVTIDQNITIGNDTTTAAITINSGGKLQVLSTAAAAYTLTCKGNFVVNGTLEIGTVANPIPVGKEFTILLNYSASLADGEYGMLIGESAAGTVTLQGATKTYYKSLLDVNASVSDNHIHTADNTGWKDNDVLALAPTSRTYSEYETLTMNGDASDDVINFDSPASLAYAHSGTSPTQAEVVNLTRTVKIKSYNSSYPGYISIKNASTVIDWDWVEFNGLGLNAANKYGAINFLTNALSTAAAIRYCSFYGGEYHHIYQNIASNKLDIQDCVFHISADHCINIASSVTASTLQNLYIIGTTGTGKHGVYINSDFLSSTLSYITAAGCRGVSIYINKDTTDSTLSYLTAHSGGNIGIQIGLYKTEVSNLTSWRNTLYGLATGYDSVIDTATVFGNQGSSGYNIYINPGMTRIYGATINSDPTYTTGYGVYHNNGAISIIENSTFGGTTAHSVADVGLATQSYADTTLIKCTLSTTPNIYQYYKWGRYNIARLHNVAGVEGTHIAYKRQGIIEPDSTVYKTAAPSEKLTPYYAAEKLESHSKYFTCADGATKTVSVWVRKSADYDGDEPRLILKRNYAAGVTTDTVLDTMTAAVETWEQLSGACTAPSEDTVYEVVVDCADGTAAGHYINVDDWTVA